MRRPIFDTAIVVFIVFWSSGCDAVHRYETLVNISIKEASTRSPISAAHVRGVVGAERTDEFDPRHRLSSSTIAATDSAGIAILPITHYVIQGGIFDNPGHVWLSGAAGFVEISDARGSEIVSVEFTRGFLVNGKLFQLTVNAVGNAKRQ